MKMTEEKGRKWDQTGGNQMKRGRNRMSFDDESSIFKELQLRAAVLASVCSDKIGELLRSQAQKLWREVSEPLGGP